MYARNYVNLLMEKTKCGKCQRRNAFKQDRLSISSEESAGLSASTFGLNAHFLQCGASCHASVRVSQSQTVTYNHNFIVLLLLSSRISQNWSAPDSIRCFINGE